jgi:hypothetical protein
MALIRELRPSLNIAGLQPLVEVMWGDQGWSAYRDREIVSGADARLPFEEQGATRSSSLARFLGSMLNYPPAKIDHLISGWTGGLGRDVVQHVVDPVVRAVGLDEVPGEPMKFEDWLIVRRFLGRGTRSGHEGIRRFFDTAEELARINAGANLRKESGDADEYEAYVERHESDLELHRIYSRTQRRMGKRFSELRGLYRSRELPADELDREITRIYDEVIELAQEAGQARADYEQEPTP